MKAILGAILILIHLTTNADSIKWVNCSIDDAKTLASSEGKLLMLYFHFKGCPPCERMEKEVFVNDSVSKFINSKIIALNIDIKSAEKSVLNKFNVSNYPTILFIDCVKNQETHRVVAYQKVKDFTHSINLALSNKGLSYYNDKINELQDEQLRQYIYLLDGSSKLDSNYYLVNKYLNSLSDKDLDNIENRKFIYWFATYGVNKDNSKSYIEPCSKAFDYFLNSKHKFYAEFEPEQVDARIQFLIFNAKDIFIAKKDSDEYKKLTDYEILNFGTQNYSYKMPYDNRQVAYIPAYLRDFNESMADYYFKNETAKYNIYENQKVKEIWNNPNELNELATNYLYSNKFNNEERLLVAIKCSKRAIQLIDIYVYNETYASLLYKLGRYNEAKTIALKAIEIAKKTKNDYSESQALLDKISAKLN